MAVKKFTFSLVAACLCVCFTGAVPVDKSTRSWPFAPHALIRRARQADYNVTEDSSESSYAAYHQCYFDRTACYERFQNTEFITMTQGVFENDQSFVTNAMTLQTLCSEVQALVQCLEAVGSCDDSSGGGTPDQMEYMCTPEGRQGYLALNGHRCAMDPFRSPLVEQCVEDNSDPLPTVDLYGNATSVDVTQYDYCGYQRAWRTCVGIAAVTNCGQVVADFMVGVVQSSMAPECLD